jgi:glycolate oxidase
MTAEFDDQKIIRDTDVLDSYSQDVSGLIGAPEGVFRPADMDELCCFMRWAAKNSVNVLPVGAQTSTTGASVAEMGVIIDLHRMVGEPRLDLRAKCVSVSASMRLGDLQRTLWTHELDLPPDPTSWMECTVGGAVATNASGPSTFKYGPISNFLEAITFVDGMGRVRRIQKSKVDKSAMGPVALQNPLSWFAGSEGLLGVIVDVEFRLVDRCSHQGAVFVGFREDSKLFAGVSYLRRNTHAWDIRAIEWLDGEACNLIRPKAARLKVPDGSTGGLYIEVEGASLEKMETNLLGVVEALEPFGVDAEKAQVLSGRASLGAFGALRHEVPDKMNRLGKAMRDAEGGGKLSTDWSVPLEYMDELLQWSMPLLVNDGAERILRYGHIGNGHPHLNILCPDSASKKAVGLTLHRQLEKVMKCGGVPTSEHGIGKLKRELVSKHLPPGFSSALRGLKAEFDPKGILSLGNIVKEL